MPNMGLGGGLEKSSVCIKRKFRWLFTVPDICGDTKVNSLPPAKASRPAITFKEVSAEHLNETIFIPSKPEWKPVTLHLYDLKRPINPVFNWIKQCYDPSEGTWTPSSVGFKKSEEVRLVMLSACGEVVESWKFENAYPQVADFGELDMGNSEYITVDLTLRYDRAYIEEGTSVGGPAGFV